MLVNLAEAIFNGTARLSLFLCFQHRVLSLKDNSDYSKLDNNWCKRMLTGLENIANITDVRRVMMQRLKSTVNSTKDLNEICSDKWIGCLICNNKPFVDDNEYVFIQIN